MKYPIWHKVEAYHYARDKSYGGKNNSRDTILVGSSVTNSYELVNTITKRRSILHPKYGKVISFRYYVDNVCIKQMIFKDVKGRADKLLHTKTILKRVKGIE